MDTIDILITIILSFILIVILIYSQKLPRYNDIDKKISSAEKKMLKNKLKKVIDNLGYHNNIFIIQKETMKLLKANPFDTNTLEKLIKEITEFLKIPFTGTVEVDFVNNNQNQNSGQFIQTKTFTKIKFLLNENYSLDQLVAIACHECTHLYLYNKGIVLKDQMENEIFTDIAAIYLGFEKYISKGYQINEKVKINSIEKRKIGYISLIEINYLIRKIRKYRKNRGN